MKHFLLVLLICFSTLTIMAQGRNFPSRPDETTVKKILRTFPEWRLNSSGRCANRQKDGLWAWKVILDRQINPIIKSAVGQYGKGFLIVILVPNIGIDPGNDFVSLFDWTMPPTDLNQYTVFVGRGSGYYWYMKGDIYSINKLRTEFKLNHGEDMDILMANALNDEDFDLYTIRAATEYFRGAGSKPVPHILNSMKQWQKKSKNVPIQHLRALKMTGSKEAVDHLIGFASGEDTRLAFAAIGELVNPPFLASDKFYLSALAIPEYTTQIIAIFRFRKKTELLLPRMRKIAKAPRTFDQYVVAVGAIREFENPKKFKHIPEYDAINDILFLSLRMGDTGDTMKYISLDQPPKGSSSKLDTQERERIEPALNTLRNSKDYELVLSGGLILASFNPQGSRYSKEYITRIRKNGLEVIRMLPAPYVIERLNILERSLERSSEKHMLTLIRRQYGR